MMMKTTRTRLEVVPASEPVPAPPPRSAGRVVATAAAVLVFAAVGAAAWLGNAELERLLAAQDDEALAQASRTLEELVKRQREQLVSEVKVLADDNRIRATVLAPKFDQATVQDVLEDLRKSSGATLLAVLDAGGKVQAVTGAVSLREVDLSASTAVRAAFERPTSDIWTLPDQVQVIGLAPIRSGSDTPALLVKGLPLAKSQLATVETALGVAGAVFIGDRVAASSSSDAQHEEALRGAARLADGLNDLAAGGRPYRVKIGRAGEGATAARLAWVVPHRRPVDCARALTLLLWSSVPLAGLLLLIGLVNSRRTNGGNA
ncbi:MAG: cache domain-containing protein [Pseudomonadota bacterium]